MRWMLALALLAATCSCRRSCDDAALGAGLASPAQSMPETVRRACPLPDEVDRVLGSLAEPSPDARFLLAVRNPRVIEGWVRGVCADARGALAAAAGAPPDHRTERFVEACTGLHDVGDREEILSADPGLLVAGTALYGWLVRNEVPRARDIARHVAGLQ